MSRRAARCTQADLNRAIKVAGDTATVTILPDGTINIVPIETVVVPPKQQQTYIYFVQAKESRRIKIGFSARLGKRLLAISTYCPEPVMVLAVILGTMQQELALHKRFAAHRVIGEWFRDAPEILNFIESADRVTERA